MRKMMARSAFASLLAAGLLAPGGFGCNGDDNNAMPASTGSAGAGGSSDQDGGTGGAGGGATDTLYSRLGGHMGIRMAVDAIVADELKDAELASFFVFQTSPTPTPGHPTADQLEECFTNQLGKAAGGSETFPGALGADHGGYVCRADMMAIHQQFHISSAQFDKFIMIAGMTLTGLGVGASDIATIASVLNSVKSAIVDPNAPGGPFKGGPGSDAGTDAPTTLYQRLGGHAGIRMALEQVVAAELADTTIAPYFSSQTATTTPAGHPNADQVEECLTDQLGSAAGGPETYPVILGADHGGWQCRDMVAIHQSMGISSATFDKFVMIAADKLTSLGVSIADVATIGTVLNSTKPQIVSASDAGND